MHHSWYDRRNDHNNRKNKKIYCTLSVALENHPAKVQLRVGFSVEAQGRKQRYSWWNYSKMLVPIEMWMLCVSVQMNRSFKVRRKQTDLTVFSTSLLNSVLTYC